MKSLKIAILCHLVIEASADLSRYTETDYDYGNENLRDRDEYKSNNRLNQKSSSKHGSNKKSFKPSGSVNFDGCEVSTSHPDLTFKNQRCPVL